MKRTAASMLLIAALLTGCALQPQNEIPVAVVCPPPRPVPAGSRAW